MEIQVRVYTAKPCGYCRAAIRYLEEVKGLQAEEIDLTGNYQARMDLVERSGQRTVPQIFIGETHIGGYSDLRAWDANGKLDQLLLSLKSKN